MYERFTDRARKVMILANQFAQKCNNENIGVEHIFVGLLREGHGTGCSVLRNLDYVLPNLEKVLSEKTPKYPEMVTMGKRPMTPRAEEVIDCAIKEARDFKHNYVGTEHLLLGLIQNPNEITDWYFKGISVDKVREAVKSILKPDKEETKKDEPKQMTWGVTMELKKDDSLPTNPLNVINLELRPYDYHLLLTEIEYLLTVAGRDNKATKRVLKVLADQGGIDLVFPEDAPQTKPPF